MTLGSKFISCSSPLFPQICRAHLCLCYHEMQLRGSNLEPNLTRHGIYWCLDFGLPASQTVRSKFYSMVFCYSFEEMEGKIAPTPHDRTKRTSESPAPYYIDNWLSPTEPIFLPPSLLSLLLSFFPVVEFELRALCMPGTDILKHLHSSPNMNFRRTWQTVSPQGSS